MTGSSRVLGVPEAEVTESSRVPGVLKAEGLWYSGVLVLWRPLEIYQPKT